MSNVGAEAKRERLRVTVDPATIRPLGSMVLLEMMPANGNELALVNEEHLLAIDTSDWDAVVRMESLQ